jgi:mono/diheme cytochrome c family protein
MKFSLLLSALALTAVFALSGQDRPDGESKDLPDGEGMDLVADRCTGCHELEQVTSHTGTRDDWGGVVYAMAGHGLEVTPEETEQIVAYLAKHFPPPKKAVAPLPDGEGKDLVMKRCADCHGIDQVQAHSGTKENWDGVVKYMISLGAAATPEERSRIVVYLAKNFPPPAKEEGKGKASEPAKPDTPPSDTPAPTGPPL